MELYINNGLKFYIILVPIISILLIIINYIISPNNSNIDKTGPYECGFTSFRQSRITYSISFILIAILFLPFDIEITTILPYTISIYTNHIYGLFILVYFFIALLVGFIMEINIGALYIKRLFIRHNKSLYTLLYNK